MSNPIQATSSTARPLIDLTVPRYDQHTYIGRVKHFLDVIDPATLLADDKQINSAKLLVNNYRANGWAKIPNNINVEDLYAAKKTLDSTIHPDTHEKIFGPFRFSAFVPMNIPIVVGMLGANTTVSTIIWQAMNQSLNVAVNHANRNASNSMSTQQIALAYSGAVLSSCSIAIGLGKFVNYVDTKQLFQPLFRSVIRTAVPFLAVSTAGALNVFLMRRNEIKEGIAVKDQYGEIMGTSQIAGKKAIQQVALTRVALPAPILLFPPIIMNGIDKYTELFRLRPQLKAPLNVLVITICLWAALPLAIGLFPQLSTMNAKDLEPQFHNKNDSQGKPLQAVYFNKGL
jgi:tricarboxylate carrier